MNYDKLEFHELADLFPKTEGDELMKLAQDIKDHTLIEPIVLYEGKILDGRNRYRAAKMYGTALGPENFEQFEEKYPDQDPVEFVISKNIRRRHLTVGQRNAIAGELYALMEKRKPGGDQKSFSGKSENDLQPSAEQKKKEAMAKTGATKSGLEAGHALFKADKKKHAEVKAGTKKLSQAEAELKGKKKTASTRAPMKQEQWQQQLHKPSPAEQRIMDLEAKVRELEALVLPLDEEGKTAVAQHRRFLNRQFKLWRQQYEAMTKAHAVTLDSKDFRIIRAGLHSDTEKAIDSEVRKKAYYRFLELFEKHVITEADKPKWPPKSAPKQGEPLVLTVTIGWDKGQHRIVDPPETWQKNDTCQSKVSCEKCGQEVHRYYDAVLGGKMTPRATCKCKPDITRKLEPIT